VQFRKPRRDGAFSPEFEGEKQTSKKITTPVPRESDREIALVQKVLTVVFGLSLRGRGRGTETGGR
jgi:hypothetical protein